MTLKCGKGRKQVWAKEELSCAVVSRKASATPTGSSGAEVASADLSRVRRGQTTNGALDRVVVFTAIPHENRVRAVCRRHFQHLGDYVLHPLKGESGRQSSVPSTGVFLQLLGWGPWPQDQEVHLCIHSGEPHVPWGNSRAREVSEAFLYTLQNFWVCQTQGIQLFSFSSDF